MTDDTHDNDQPSAPALNSDALTNLLRQRLNGPRSGTAGQLMSHLTGQAAEPPPPATGTSRGVPPDPTQGGGTAPADMLRKQTDSLERALRQAASRSH